MVQDFRYSVTLAVVGVVLVVIVAHLRVVPQFYWLESVCFHACDLSILLTARRLFV